MTTSSYPTSVLLERNLRYATGHVARSLAPDEPMIVLTCVDSRTDPAHVLGVEPGSCLVYRNTGGRVTDESERELALLATMMRAAAGSRVPSVVVMHHHDCGLARLTDPQLRGTLATASGMDSEDLERRVIDDPARTVVADVARLAEHPVFAEADLHALLFDVETGVATEVTR